MMHIDTALSSAKPIDRDELKSVERWILSRLNETTKSVNKALSDYRYDEASNAIYQFFWHEFCDWYIEMVKPVLLGRHGTEADQQRAKRVLLEVLDRSLRLLHPFMPFITEEIWQQLPKASGAPQSIMITLYPMPDPRFVDDASEGSMALVQKVITTIRALRTERNVPSSVRSRVVLTVADDYKKTILEGYQHIVAEHGRCREVAVRRSGDPPAGALVTGLAGDVEVILFLEGTSDTPAERAKLEKERNKLAGDRDHLAKKLENPQFVERAPALVLEKDRARLAEMEAALQRLTSALERLA